MYLVLLVFIFNDTAENRERENSYFYVTFTFIHFTTSRPELFHPHISPLHTPFSPLSDHPFTTLGGDRIRSCQKLSASSAGSDFNLRMKSNEILPPMLTASTKPLRVHIVKHALGINTAGEAVCIKPTSTPRYVLNPPCGLSNLSSVTLDLSCVLKLCKRSSIV